MFAYHSSEPANQVLNIIDTESCGVVRGIEREVLEFKWRFHQLPAASLPAALSGLIDEGLLRLAGHMVRLTGAGYARLTAAGVEEAAPLPTAPANTGRPTEYDLRGKLLSVFNAQGVGRLSAGELHRFWSVAGYRAQDLRNGLDLLLRDGHSKVGRFTKTLFRLESDGERYRRGAAAPEWLVKDAIAFEEANLRKRGLPDRLLCILAARQFLETSGKPLKRAWSEVDYLLERYELPEFARFHAYELLHRLGYAEAAGGNTMQLTGKGHELLKSAEGELAEWSIPTAMKAADSEASVLPRAAS